MSYNEFDKFVRKMYKENCKERIAYGEKPYDDINYYECKNYQFLVEKFREENDNPFLGRGK